MRNLELVRCAYTGGVEGYKEESLPREFAKKNVEIDSSLFTKR